MSSVPVDHQHPMSADQFRKLINTLGYRAGVSLKYSYSPTAHMLRFLMENIDELVRTWPQDYPSVQPPSEEMKKESTTHPLTYIDREEVNSYGGQELTLAEVAEKMIDNDAFSDTLWLCMEYAVESLLERNDEENDE